MRKVKTSSGIDNVQGESAVPAAVRLHPAWSDSFGRELGLVMNLPHGNVTALFLGKRMSASCDEVMPVLRIDSAAGYIATCDHNEWMNKVESTSANRRGTLTYSADRKARITGTGEIAASGQWRAAVKTFYPGIRNSRRVNAQF